MLRKSSCSKLQNTVIKKKIGISCVMMILCRIMIQSLYSGNHIQHSCDGFSILRLLVTLLCSYNM